MSRSRITKAPRAPSMRTLVRLAVNCDSAEELGRRLKRLTIGSSSAMGWLGLATAIRTSSTGCWQTEPSNGHATVSANVTIAPRPARDGARDRRRIGQSQPFRPAPSL